MGKPRSIAVSIMDALSEGPKFAEELPGPKYQLADRINAVNDFHRNIGSHWRIQGTPLHPLRMGQRRLCVLYQLVMEV